MKKQILSALVGALLAVTGLSTQADEPIELTADQMDRVTAGTGRDNIAPHAWDVLGPLGFLPTHNSAADSGVIDQAGFMGVLIPKKPGSGSLDCSNFPPCFFNPGP